jgi:hypothetical protein
MQGKTQEEEKQIVSKEAPLFTEMLIKKLNPGSAAELRFSPLLGCSNIGYISGFVLFSMFLVCMSLLFSDILANE